MMEITVGTMLKGTLMFGLQFCCIMFIVCLLIAIFKVEKVSRSYFITRMFSSEESKTRMELQQHLIKHGMTRKQSADCMNSWNKKKG